MSLPIKRLSYVKLGEIAEAFLKSYHPSLLIPIPIELIAERALGIELVPVIDMKKRFDAEACLASSLKTIFIDYRTYMNFENRARFSIAHEIAHIVLHAEIFISLNIKTESDIVKLSKKITEEEYDWLEFQAYSFAGHVLVPQKKLLQEVESRLGKVPSYKFLPEEIFPISQELLETFNVSGEVLARRLQKDGIIRSNKSF